jgi:hypothetical protein
MSKFNILTKYLQINFLKKDQFSYFDDKFEIFTDTIFR